MATPVLIPLAEYLATSYSPDCNYIDGEVQERNMGEKPHSGLQTALIGFFLSHRLDWRVEVWVEQRTQVAATRFRVPDVCLTTLDDRSDDPIIRKAPLLCVEILSSEQSLRDMQLCADDYQRMGVRAVWVFDPVRRLAWTADAQGKLVPAEDLLAVPETSIRSSVSEVFAEYDCLRSGR